MKSEVDVYRNLHRGDKTDRVYSVRTRHDGLVAKHVRGILLHDVEFFVSAKGNDRVRDEMRKNVHAFVRGKWITYTGHRPVVNMISPQEMLKQAKTMAVDGKWVEVTYDPYKYKTFVTVKEKRLIAKSAYCFVGHRCWAVV